MIQGSWDSMVQRTLFSHLVFVLSFGQGLGRLATDPRCPPFDCCVFASDVGQLAGVTALGQDCDFGSPWTRAYCCADGREAQCYHWAEDAPGHDLKVSEAISGVHCRHLCQAHVDCGFWSYIVDVPEAQHMRGRCFLKATTAVDVRTHSHPYVVSGMRLCEQFAEGLPGDGLNRRELHTAKLWRTSANAVAASAATWLGRALLPAAGALQWNREAADVVALLGFVVVLGVLALDQVRELREAAVHVANAMLDLDPQHIGNRGPRRYSYGGAAHRMHMMHVQPWPRLLDVPAVHTLLATIFPDGYVAAGGGGDFVLGHTDTFQSLHVDIGGGQFHDRERPPAIAVNFVLDEITCAGGPLRVVAGSQWEARAPPTLIDESEDSKSFAICPLPAGSVVVRDLRTWHGGTPNALSTTRYLPNAEFVDASLAPYVCGRGGYLDPCSPVLPAAAHARLSDEAQAISTGIVSPVGDLEELHLFVDGVERRPGDWFKLDFAEFTRHSADAY